MKRVCICKGWKKSIDQISGAQILAHTHGVSYTGDPFIFCPWCGHLLIATDLSDEEISKLDKIDIPVDNTLQDHLKDFLNDFECYKPRKEDMQAGIKDLSNL